MYDGWLWLSTLKVTAQPSPMSTTPAFSPMPTRSFSFISSVVFSLNCARWTFEDLYEQCSDHMTEYIANSAMVGRRPRISRMRSYSSAFSPSSDQGCETSGVVEASPTVSMLGLATEVIGDLGWKPCPSGQGGNLAWSGRFWFVL